MISKELIDRAINQLGSRFNDLDLTFHAMKNGKPGDITSYWPGREDEDVLVCVFKGPEIREPFHRQDFFFINYAYQNSYQALSDKYNNLIEIHEDECYIGQPYSGYALRKQNTTEDATIIGILIRKDSFFQEYLPTIYTDAKLFRFFIEPQANQFSDEFIHLSAASDPSIRSILEMMVLEYVHTKEDTQRLLKSMLQTLFLSIARRYRIEKHQDPQPIHEQILEYMVDHSDQVSLQSVAQHFGYHPNYVSSMIRRKTGRTFSELLLEKRMERAVLLMKHTTLSIEEISVLLGYSNHSNFYKAFKEYYGVTPREYE